MMSVQKYPIGIQTFEKIAENGMTYVDKTRFIGELVNEPAYYFLSRPRRFGKSLFLSTLHAYFDGKRELFRGLALDSMEVDWTPRPVFHFDLNAADYLSPNGLTDLLSSQLRRYEKQWEIVSVETAVAQRFDVLIEEVYKKTRRKVVVLIDEYDKPLFAVDENNKLYERNQSVLKSFFGVLKSQDRNIAFAMLTGVARFRKVSIFSDLNNLHDISISDRYADICGWTETELIDNFRPSIEALANERREGFETTLVALRHYYDGYCFSRKGNRLYNPFSVLNALAHKSLRAYWFASGTPTFLVRSVKSSAILLTSLNRQWCSASQLEEVGITSSNPVPLLFQTGYLTICGYDSERERYELQFPNYEVEVGFARHLLPLYAPKATEPDSEFDIFHFQDDLVDGRPEDFMLRLQTLLKGMPYEQHDEKSYQNIVYILCTLSATDTDLERHNNHGRTDLEVKTRRFIYIFEFKFNRTAEEAMAQIYARDYAGRFALDSRTVYMIGANFSTHKRGLDSWLIEKKP